MNSDEIKDAIYQLGHNARTAAHQLAQLTAEKKSDILRAMATSLRADTAAILEANAKDIDAAETKGLTGAMLDRLKLDADRVDAIAAGIEQVADLPDPVGEHLEKISRPNGIEINKVRVPIGVIGIIFESRPNVTSDAAVLCLKSGNATILRGGSEAIHSNKAIAKALQSGGEPAGLPAGAIQLIPFTDRESVAVLAGMDKYLDLIIPRGGKGLIETVVSLARMPVIKHYDGICHAYVDRAADQDLAVAIIDDGKTQKPSVCNALETVLVHKDIADEFLPKLKARLDQRGVEIRADEATQKIIDGTTPAEDADWVTEYLDLIIAVKVVDSTEAAIEHINTHSSQHSEVIITTDDAAAQHFLTAIDSACVYHNVSTRFSDGEEFGFGAEIGISTDKLHARGPMGLKELTSYQYRITGDGQIKDKARQDALD
ncbi:glutamate-5-semialdehyde dehydrogenase [Verrucomicrobiaceae bacterium R5-34]|uniref:Gamma-glutamyl phosphate reductase n=1 Tax=Oceaniferula flava TaxID=2800421 RepID=A0AAE2SFV6_9BACT|nr:glutamate-5-semialdehyde dehydrogenase [Oceaniferula flavus]MBK1831075.1 glutamate-5-semialdehyde dehydrogenase [Verrucomicrobiaceae bacterium R5-34]MBK1855591.1 glutamate-5-semialdehyde dehydrogenase [Oceaniferula flavus]MBM1136897.1 glutamate-5-semialdehyde dehydrogenase [Oceaniferula flavus]